MKRFFALYILFLGILFALFYAPASMISSYINTTQTHLTLLALDIFLAPEQLQDINIWINPHYKIIITKSCNGIIPILFLFASILAYPAAWRHKFIWSLFGYIIFFIVNIIRILWVVYATKSGEGQKEFYWSHDIVGNALLIATGLILFILFIKSSSKNS